MANLDPATADPRSLAEALRREYEKAKCPKWSGPDGALTACRTANQFAAFALAVLDECEKMHAEFDAAWSDRKITDSRIQLFAQGANDADRLIRVAARAYYGGTLPAPEGE